MSDPVDPDKIEGIVGITRHPTLHYGRAVSEEQVFYVLHSGECKEREADLRDCVYSKALDLGICETFWADHEDRPVALEILQGRLVPKNKS